MARGIKVPVSLKVLVVDGPTGTFAGGTADPPLTDGPALPAGVHLDWSLPDALTVGRPVAGTSRLLFSAVPDVWLVVRYARSATGRLRTRAWQVDARTGVVVGVDAPLPPRTITARLTAVGFQADDGRLLADDGVTPLPDDTAAFRSAWAVYYPDTGRRFGFHDDLADRPTGALSYQVIGWYRSLADDPLHGAGDAWSRWTWLGEAGWKVDGLAPPLRFDGSAVVGVDLDQLFRATVRLPDAGPIHLDGELLGPGTWADPIQPADPIGPVDVVDVRGAGPAVDREVLRRADVPLDRAREVRPGDLSVDPAAFAGRLRTDRPERAVGPQPPGVTGIPGVTGPTGGTDRPERVSGPQPTGVPGVPGAPDGAADRPERVTGPTPERGPTVLAASAGKTTVPAALSMWAERLVTDDEVIDKALRQTAAGAALPPSLRDRLVLDPAQPLFDQLAESDDDFPDRIYCHGQVIEVRNAGDGGVFDDIGPARPDTQLAFTVGSSSSDAIAQLLAADPTQRWLLHAVTSLRTPDMGALGGLPRVVQHLHQQAFQPLDGGFRVEDARDPGLDTLTREVDRLPESALGPKLTAAGVPENVVRLAYRLREDALHSDKGQALLTGLVEAAGLSDGRARSKLTAASRPVLAAWRRRVGAIGGAKSMARVADELLAELPSLGVGPQVRPGVRRVRRPLPRYWTPRAPVVLVHGPKRSWRRGDDGRLDADGQLQCRLTGEHVGALSLLDGVTVTSSDLLDDPAFLDRMTTTIRELVREAPLLDPAAAGPARTAMFRKSQQHTAAFSGAMPRLESSEDRFRAETTFWWNAALPGVQASEIAAWSRYEGKLPSLLAIEPWRQAWDPVFVEYEARFWPLANPIPAAFTLGEVEHERRTPQLAADAIVLRGRAVPSAVAASSLATALTQLATAEGRAAATAAQEVDVLSFALDGLDRELVARGLLHRAGALEIVRLRLVDVFGQAIELDVPGRELIVADEQIATPNGRRGWLLPPRLPRRARLLLRLLRGDADAANPAAPEADGDHHPLCGFLVADHIDHAVEVFSATGESLGQLRHTTATGSEVLWEPAPGAEPALGDQASSIANPWLRQLVQGVLTWNRVPFDPPAGQPDETALSALIRVLDTVRHTVSSTGASAEHLSALIGRPVAVVRAAARLDLPDGGALPPGLELRLGSLTQPDDGLLAYFARDDFHRLHPPHAAVRDAARDSGPGRGYQRAGGGQDVRPIHHPYVVVDPTVDLPDTRPVPLVLLMDPGGGVHATTGVLPRKRIALEKGWVDGPLSRLSPTFRVGPVLVDPARLGLPVPGLERYTWQWVHRTDPPGTPDNWDTVPVAQASDAALLPEGTAVVHEGWLRLVSDP